MTRTRKTAPRNYELPWSYSQGHAREINKRAEDDGKDAQNESQMNELVFFYGSTALNPKAARLCRSVVLNDTLNDLHQRYIENQSKIE